jgi:hypothetical protein
MTTRIKPIVHSTGTPMTNPITRKDQPQYDHVAPSGYGRLSRPVGRNRTQPASA